MSSPLDRADAARDELQVQRLRLWARAHHEAAHAVLATLLGSRVVGVELWSGPPVGGRVRLAEPTDAEPAFSDYRLVRRIAFLLAGPIAERIAGSEAGAILNEAASVAATTLLTGLRDAATIDRDTDLGTVTHLLLEYFGPDGEVPAAAAADHLPLGVEECVREHWHAIQVVVAALLRSGRLTEEEFQGLVALALPAPSPPDLLRELPARTSG